MQVVAAALATAFAALLVFVQPFTGRRRYRALVARLEYDSGARLRHYRRGIAGEWIGVGIVVLIGLLAGRTAASIGWRWPDQLGYSLFLIAEIAALLFVTTLVLRRRVLRGLLLRQARGFIALLPRTVEERRTFAVLAVTAGICEEILFRAFGIAYVRFVWASASDAWIIVLTSVAFGFAHLYQGLRGVVLTGIVGAVFASLVLTTGSLFAAMAIHAMIDLRILGLPDLTTDAGTSGFRRLPAE